MTVDMTFFVFREGSFYRSASRRAATNYLNTAKEWKVNAH
jgi:hypothetical protein